MRPALLILMMDFLVASLLLYVTDTSVINKGVKTISMQSDVVDRSESVWGSISEMEQEWDKEVEKYYTEFMMLQNKDDKINSLKNENDELTKLLQIRQAEIDQEAKNIQTAHDQLIEKSNQIESLITEKSNLSQVISEKNQEIVNNQGKISEKDRVIVSMQNLSTKAFEDIHDTNIQLREKQSELEKIKERLSGTEKSLAEQKQKTLTIEEEKIRIQKELEIEQHQRRELLEKTKEDISQLKKDEADRYTNTQNKFDSLEKSQASTQLAIQNFNTKIDQIPEMFREAAQNIIQENQKILNKNNLLKKQIQTQVAAVDPQAAQRMITELQSIKETNQKIEQHLKNLKSGGSSKNIEKNIKALNELDEQQRELQKGIDNQASATLAQKKGIFATVNEARLEINGLLTSKALFSGFNENKILTYPINVRANGQVYAVSHASSMGLEWNKISDKLQTESYSIRMTPTKSNALNDIQSSSSTLCKIILIPHNGEGVSYLSLYQSLDEIRARAMESLHIFKHSMRTSKINVETGIITLNEANKTLEFSRAKLEKWISSNIPEPGDFVVSENAYLVGVMKDWKTCILVTEGDISETGQKISLSTHQSFLDSVNSYRNNCSN